MPSETSTSETRPASANVGSLIESCLSQPTSARLWDLAGGGKDSFQADRALFAEISTVTTSFSDLARANRRFVRGAADFLAAERGITQYIDLGVGLPSRQGSLHDFVQLLDGRAKVAYVDKDPIVLAHANGLLSVNDKVLVVTGDLRDPDQVLHQPKMAAFMDWSQPIALFCTAVLHYCPGDALDIAALMQTYVDALPDGSCVVISHFLDPDAAESHGVVRQIEKVLTSSSIGGGWFRTQDELEAMFPGLTMLSPGVAPCRQWWPDLAPEHGDSWIEDCIAGGIGQKGSPRR